MQLQCVASKLRLPVAIGNHRDTFGAAVQRYSQRGFYPLNCACGAVIQRDDFCTEHRWARNDGSELSGQVHVDAEILLATALGLGIDARSGLANDAEIPGILERDLVGHGQRHRSLCQFPVTRFKACRAKHHARLSAKARDLHVPACGRCREQHGPSARTQFAVLGVAVFDRIGAAGEVHAEDRVLVGRVVIAVAATHETPVGIEFLSENHRQSGLNTLTEL
ncbi:hypothetical protein D3C76_856100 [compost metagenome]